MSLRGEGLTVTGEAVVIASTLILRIYVAAVGNDHSGWNLFIGIG